MTDDTTIDPGDPGDGDVPAAEYVLGVLGAAERSGVEQRLAREPALASEAAFWEERLSGLADAVEPVPPPPDAWSRIESAIAAEAAVSAAPARPPLWQNLAFWRGLTLASATLSAASLAALAYVVLAPTARAPLLATLSSSDSGQPNFVATVTAQGNSLVIVPAALLTNDPRAYELWLIPSSNARPRSLGLIQPGQPIRLDVPADLAGRLTPDAALAVSREPPGGSPTGQPTSTPIASGKLTNL
jgi:anti-sigma-K factor RskA